MWGAQISLRRGKNVTLANLVIFDTFASAA
jgi:hypothetical protein